MFLYRKNDGLDFFRGIFNLLIFNAVVLAAIYLVHGGHFFLLFLLIIGIYSISRR